jgi:coenzyme F420 hydrogenase subunit beta
VGEDGTGSMVDADSRPGTPAERLYAIVEQGLCIGCGLCQAVAGPHAVEVRKVSSGYEAPVVVGPLDHVTVDTIYDVCPGTRVDGLPLELHTHRTRIDMVWGSWQRIVRAWASDPEVRYRGSTGGVLTALGQFLLHSGRVDFILHVKPSDVEPTFGEPTLSFTGADVLAGSGSRYGPTAPLRYITDVLDRGRPFAVIAKPCDIGALRNWARHDPRVDELVRYRLTMVCGGFGPPEFTNGFLHRIGVDPAELTAFRYRGHGCPGPTRAETADRVEEHHYLDYWGDDASQWSLPWRCKICPDGIGESADLAASDTWPGGSPTRQDSERDPGTNAIIVRTDAGRDLLDAAVAAGAVTIDGDGDITPDEMTMYQPHQMRKKYTVGSRHEALGQVGRIVPVTNGLRIGQLAGELPAEVRAGQREGALQRIADGKATQPTPE